MTKGTYSKIMTGLAVAGCVLLAALIFTAVWAWTHCVVVGWRFYPKDAASLDLRGRSPSVEQFDTLNRKLPGCEIGKAQLGDICSQYFAVLTNAKSVGVMGDGRTYENVLALRSVTTKDFMTAEWTRIPYEVLDRVSVRIVNEVPRINRIVYDITSKPPATVEWE